MWAMRTGAVRSNLLESAMRIAQIMELAKAQGRVGVEDLATHFAVTPQTIRKDLNELCDRRILTRIHGGALFTSGAVPFRLAFL